MHFKNKLIVMVVLGLMAGLSTSVAVAQEEEQNEGIARVVLITPKDGHEEALEEAITDYHHYMGGKEGAMRYQWYSIETGPDTGKYIARSGGHNWADFDATHDWDKKAGEKFASDVNPHVADVDIFITRSDRELGMWPESMEGYQYFMVSNWNIKPGKGSVFNDGIKKIDAALKAGGWPNYYSFTYNVTGGKGNTVTLVSPRKNYADMAEKEPGFMDIMNKAMGEEEAAAFVATWAESYWVGEKYMLKHQPALSDYGQKK